MAEKPNITGAAAVNAIGLIRFDGSPLFLAGFRISTPLIDLSV
jgi:hypothetical protein